MLLAAVNGDRHGGHLQPLLDATSAERHGSSLLNSIGNVSCPLPSAASCTSPLVSSLAPGRLFPFLVIVLGLPAPQCGDAWHVHPSRRSSATGTHVAHHLWHRNHHLCSVPARDNEHYREGGGGEEEGCSGSWLTSSTVGWTAHHQPRTKVGRRRLRAWARCGTGALSRTAPKKCTQLPHELPHCDNGAMPAYDAFASRRIQQAKVLLPAHHGMNLHDRRP
jgi:hypothetical protein